MHVRLAQNFITVVYIAAVDLFVSSVPVLAHAEQMVCCEKKDSEREREREREKCETDGTKDGSAARIIVGQSGESGRTRNRKREKLQLPAARVPLPVLDETRQGAFIDKCMNSNLSRCVTASA